MCRFRQSGGIAGGRRDIIVWADGTVEPGDADEAAREPERRSVDAAAVAALDALLSGPAWQALPARGGPVPQDAFVFSVVTPGRWVQWSEAEVDEVYTKALELLVPLLPSSDPAP